MSQGKESKLMIVDWEIGQLYLNCLKKYSQEEALLKRYAKNISMMLAKKKDLYFFLGTTLEGHRRRFLYKSLY